MNHPLHPIREYYLNCFRESVVKRSRIAENSLNAEMERIRALKGTISKEKLNAMTKTATRNANWLKGVGLLGAGAVGGYKLRDVLLGRRAAPMITPP